MSIKPTTGNEQKTVFELSSAGRRGMRYPKSDVPKAERKAAAILIAAVMIGILIRVIFSDGEEYSAEYRLEIIGFRLPDQELPVTNWFHSDGLLNYYGTEFASDEYWRIMENFASCAVQNGINTLLVPVFTPPLDMAVGGERTTTQLVGVSVSADGSYSFDFSLLDKYIGICLKAGAKYLEISHLYTQWGCRNAPKVMGTGPDGVLRRLSAAPDFST